MTTIAYKVFSSTLCSPLQGGEPVWDGSLPFNLPIVEVDSSNRECGFGWNACLLQEDALRIGGLWLNGYPARLFRVETEAPVYERDDKVRASTWEIIEEIHDLRPAIERLSKQFHCPGVVEEQVLWREALGRPNRDRGLIEAGLMAALAARGLSDWTLQEFDSEEDTWTAWDAWDARNARDARTAWAARDAWNARDARDAASARDAWNARDAASARAAWNAWDVWNDWEAKGAKSALTVYVAGTRGWTDQDPHLLTVGIRDAYRNGLGITLPTGPKTLGWSMEP